jgi:hypothetical protein
MSVCFQSPPSKYIYSNDNYSLSPPPTPGRKRICLSSADDIPFFFPLNKSIFGDEQQTSLEAQGDQVLSLLSNPSLPRVQLKPRPRFGTEMNKSKVDKSKMPAAPFSCTRNLQEIIHCIPPPPLVAPPPPLVSKTSSLPARRSSAVAKGDVQKLSTIQRQGMDSKTRKVVRRNSTVARCA